MHMPGTRHLLAVSVVVLMAGLWSACSESPSGPNRPDGRMVLVANVSGTSVQTLVVEVTADDITAPLLFNIEVEDGVASGALIIPAGSDRLITVSAFNGDGIETHEGSTTTDVHPGPNGAISIVLSPPEISAWMKKIPMHSQAGFSLITRSPALPDG